MIGEAVWKKLRKTAQRPQGRGRPHGLGAPQAAQALCPLSPFPSSLVGCLAAGLHLGRPWVSVREDVRALLGKFKARVHLGGLWHSHCPAPERRASRWAPVGGVWGAPWRGRWWAWLRSPFFLFINYFFKLSYSNWRIVTLL